MIHPLAVVDPGAQIGTRVRIAPFALVEAGVRIGDDCEVGPNVVIRAGTELGAGCRLRAGVVLGDPPMDSSYQGESTRVRIGRNCDLREYVTVHRSTGNGTETVIGDDVLVMTYVHIAHNCRVGNRVTVTNACQLAGHVEVEDGAVLGGMCGVHQYTRIGALAMVGACSYLAKDLPPFLIGTGNPFRVRGLNLVGLRRAGFSAEQIELLRKVYRIVYRSKHNLGAALAEIEARFPDSLEVRQFTAFCRAGRRGIQLTPEHRSGDCEADQD